MHDDSFRYLRGLALLEEQIGKIQPGTVWLDLGCNQGDFLRLLVQHRKVEGTGFDDYAPVPDLAVGWSYRQTNLERELPWTGPAQIISALEVIEHIIDTDGFLRRAFDALDKGGWIVLSTPNINSLRNRVTVPLGAYPVGPEYRTVIHHVRMYNSNVLREQLRATGFDQIRLRGVAFLPFSVGLGETFVSQRLANWFPSFCSNLMAIARKP